MSQRGSKRRICWFSYSAQTMLREGVVLRQWILLTMFVGGRNHHSWNSELQLKAPVLCLLSKASMLLYWMNLFNSYGKLKCSAKLPLQFYPQLSQLLLRLLDSVITFKSSIAYKSMCCGYFPYCTTPDCMLLLLLTMMGMIILFFTLFLPEVNILYIAESIACTWKKSSHSTYISFSIHTK